MKILKVILVMVCVMGVAQLVWSQGTLQNEEHGIPGYLDPRTHTFTARVQNDVSPVADAAPPGTYYFGTVTVTLIISVASTFPADTVIACTGTASVDSDYYNGTFYEKAGVVAPAVSGGKTTCTVSMPYYWQLSTPGSDAITVTFSVDAFNTGTVNGQTELVTLRHAERDQIPATTSVPTTNGTVSAFTYYTRI